MARKIALVSLINPQFIVMFKAFIKSFLTNNSWFNYDFILLNDGLNEHEQMICKLYYKNLSFREINKNRYVDVRWSATKDRLKPTYYKLDMFSLYDYDRVIFIDLDTIILQDIKELFTYKEDICAVRGYSRNSDSLRGDINSGVLVLNKPVLNKETYDGVAELALSGFSMPDQKVINNWFKNKIFVLDKKFNVEKRMYYSKKFNYSVDKGNIAILHLVGSKSFAGLSGEKEHEDYSEVEKVWWRYYNMLWDY